MAKRSKRELPSFIVSPADERGNVTVRIGSFHKATFAKDVQTSRHRKVDTRDPAVRAQEHGALIAGMFHKPRKIRGLTGKGNGGTSDFHFESAALFYARWLMKRDGIAEPVTSNRTKTEWAGVYVTRPDGRVVFERRIRAVLWFHNGQEVHRQDLPNWDFVPVMPVEETLADETPELLQAA